LLSAEAEFLGEIQTKILRVLLLAIHSHLYSFTNRIIFLQTHATSYVKLLYTVKEKGGKLDRKPYPLHYGLRNPNRNLKSEISQDYTQKPRRNCTFMNWAFEKESHIVGFWFCPALWMCTCVCII
jgi:hypothetical protein